MCMYDRVFQLKLISTPGTYVEYMTVQLCARMNNCIRTHIMYNCIDLVCMCSDTVIALEFYISVV